MTVSLKNINFSGFAVLDDYLNIMINSIKKKVENIVNKRFVGDFSRIQLSLIIKKKNYSLMEMDQDIFSFLLLMTSYSTDCLPGRYWQTWQYWAKYPAGS